MSSPKEMFTRYYSTPRMEHSWHRDERHPPLSSRFTYFHDDTPDLELQPLPDFNYPRPSSLQRIDERRLKGLSTPGNSLFGSSPPPEPSPCTSMRINASMSDVGISSNRSRFRKRRSLQSARSPHIAEDVWEQEGSSSGTSAAKEYRSLEPKTSDHLEKSFRSKKGTIDLSLSYQPRDLRQSDKQSIGFANHLRVQSDPQAQIPGFDSLKSAQLSSSTSNIQSEPIHEHSPRSPVPSDHDSSEDEDDFPYIAPIMINESPRDILKRAYKRGASISSLASVEATSKSQKPEAMVAGYPLTPDRAELSPKVESRMEDHMVANSLLNNDRATSPDVLSLSELPPLPPSNEKVMQSHFLSSPPLPSPPLQSSPPPSSSPPSSSPCRRKELLLLVATPVPATVFLPSLALVLPSTSLNQVPRNEVSDLVSREDIPRSERATTPTRSEFTFPLNEIISDNHLIEDNQTAPSPSMPLAQGLVIQPLVPEDEDPSRSTKELVIAPRSLPVTRKRGLGAFGILGLFYVCISYAALNYIVHHLFDDFSRHDILFRILEGGVVGVVVMIGYEAFRAFGGWIPWV
ncbi:hypothetical protein P280DRAFT_520072 [Massarina eburnea CBS 473.64]|uniref:Uncharacterized protein n=1 Tax=Massarina eburnea CBS 473.64 TaxID=1395130 RepID=A0A6A6RTB7_9PLEO|nr:hypothetical protein P280DRAFT_520072 [Massarina eburnea CBS 473.64]